MTQQKSSNSTKFRSLLNSKMAGAKRTYLGRTSSNSRGVLSGGSRRCLKIEELEDRRLLAVDLPPLLDINTNPGQLFGSMGPQIQVGPLLYFTARTRTVDQLWKTNGFDWGTSLVKSFHSVSFNQSSEPRNVANVNGTLYFAANDGTGGMELWKTDGTESGTVQVKDILPGSGSSNPTELINVAGTLYFVANDGTSGRELWKSDGTASGTQRLVDLRPGAQSSNPAELTEISGTLYFSATNGTNGRELWKSNGTVAGTVTQSVLGSGSAGSYPEHLTVVSGSLYFTATTPSLGRELWRTDASQLGALNLSDIHPGSTSSDPKELTAVGGILYFTAQSPVSGRELWRSNGSFNGTSRVRDIRPGVDSSYPKDLTNLGGVLYFSADDGTSGRELWKSSGSEFSTTRVRDINQGATGSYPSSITNHNGVLYFAANNGFTGIELWKSDGTSSGTVLVKDVQVGGLSSIPTHLISVIGGPLYFVADDGFRGIELWKSNGTENGTVPVYSFEAGTTDSSPMDIVAVGDNVFFFADDGVHGVELWKSDGTPEGTSLVKDIRPGPNGSIQSTSVSHLTNVGGIVYFRANDGVSGYELWKSDGTSAGTTRVMDIRPGLASSNPDELVNVNGVLYFNAFDETSGRELWKSNGTLAGTVQVRDIFPGTTGSNPRHLTSALGAVFFSAHFPGSGYELWKSDGTEIGTLMVKNIRPGADSSSPGGLERFVELNGTIYFNASSGSGGRTLWKSDGTETGTVSVLEGIEASRLVAVDDALYFFDNTLALNKSDGTQEGTLPLKEFFAIGSGRIVNVGSTLYFVASDGISFGLWKSDGTEAGTVRVIDLPQINTNPPVANLTNANGTIHFTRFDGQTGMELWKSDGSEEGTMQVANIAAVGSSTPRRVTVAGNKLFFTATTDTYGRELYVIDLPVVNSSIVGSHVYHAGSSFAVGGVQNALDTTKQLAKQGPVPQELTYDNLINSSRGINGLAFDFEGLPGNLTTNDFEFQISPQGLFSQITDPAEDWQLAPAPSSITSLGGNVDRVVLQWPDNAIANRWLRVTVKANGNTGLSQPEVYYIGHLLGETTGAVGGIYTVSFADITPIRGAVGQSANAGSIHDIDKSGTVSFADISAMRGNIGSVLSNITIPAAGGGGGGGSVPMHGSSGDSASRDKKLSLPTQKLDSPTHTIAPLAWGPAVDQVLPYRAAIAQPDGGTLTNRWIDPDSLRIPSETAHTSHRSGLHVHNWTEHPVNSSKVQLRNPLGPLKQNLLAIDWFFNNLNE